MPLSGDAPLNLMPPFGFEGDEDDWETHQLIEAVRARRRAAKRQGAGKALSAEGCIAGPWQRRPEAPTCQAASVMPELGQFRR